jgi:hypothetical protein
MTAAFAAASVATAEFAIEATMGVTRTTIPRDAASAVVTSELSGTNAMGTSLPMRAS